MVSSEEGGPAHSPFLYTTHHLLSFAQAALELPAITGAGDGDDVEIQPLARVARRDEHDLAQKRPVALLVALGLEHLQILVVQLTARRRLALIGGLDHGHVGKSAARQADERAGPGDRLPHAPSPSAQHAMDLLYCQRMRSAVDHPMRAGWRRQGACIAISACATCRPSKYELASWKCGTRT